MHLKETLRWSILTAVLLFPFLVRGQQSGDFDRSFNFGRGADYQFNLGNGPSSNVYCSVPLADGKILIGGVFTSINSVTANYIARLNADGSLDNSFNTTVGATNVVNAMVLQPDGKILIAGDFTTYNGSTRNRIARLNADGSLDASFTPGNGASQVINSIVLQPDGKIIIGGNFTTYAGVTRNRIARLNADGSLDTGFDPGTGADIIVRSVALQPDGLIIIGGDFTSFNGLSRNRIARLNTDGSLDANFNPGTAANGIVKSLVLQSSGKIIIGGNFTSFNGNARGYIARLNTDGTNDPSFNNGGIGANYFVESICIASDDKVLIGGQFSAYNGVSKVRIARLNTDGTNDASFNSGTGFSSTVNLVSILSNGDYFTSGSYANYNNIPTGKIARLNSNGALVTNFNTLVGSNAWLKAIALQSDGKMIVGGQMASYNGIARLRLARINTNGSLDESFNPGAGPDSDLQCIAVQPDGKIIIGGYFTSYNGTIRNRIARLNTDGSVDLSFNPGTGANIQMVWAVRIQSDGKIIIVGDFTTYNGVSRVRIARLNADGSLDTSFDPGAGANAFVPAIALQPDGKILIGGDFTSYNNISINRIARLNADGSLDASFNPGTGPGSGVTSIATQSDGKILIVGNFTTVNGVSKNYIARLNADGSLDAGFNSGTGVNTTIKVVKVQADDKILIGGAFTGFNNVVKNRFARLNADGSLEETFNPGAGLTSFSIDDLAIQTDNKIVIVGNFIGYNGLSSPNIGRVYGESICTIPTTPTILGSSIICSGGTTTLTSSATSGSHLWSNGATTQSITVSSGNYTVRTIENGCTSATSARVTITNGTTPSTPSITGNNSFCEGSFTTLTATAASSYIWSNGATSQSINIYTAGSYSVRIISGVCTSNASISVNVTSIPVPSTPTISGNNFICSGNSTTLTSSATTGNLWSNGSTAQSISVSTPGTYTVRVIASGCTSIAASITLNTVSTPNTPTITGNSTLCEGGSVVLSSSSPIGNLWSTGETTQDITVTSGGNYTVRAISNGCTSGASLTKTVSITSFPNPIFISGNQTYCVGGNTTLSAPFGYSYLWSNGATTQNIIVSNAGSYSVSLIANGCTTAYSNPVIVTVNSVNTPTISGNTTFCPGSGTTLFSSASSGNIWSNGSTSNAINVTSSGSYSVRVVANGCTSSAASISVSVLSVPSTASISGNTNICTGSSTTLIASGGNSFIWNTGATTSSITVSSSGSYSVRGVSSDCTTSVASVFVNVFSLPNTPTISGNNFYCQGGSTTLTSSSTTGNIWSTGATTQSISVSSTGTYTLRVIQNGCTSATSSPLTVTENSIPTAPTISGTSSFCAGSSTTLTSSISTGNLWSTGETSQSITVNTTGTYTVRAVSNGCTSNASGGFTVSATSLPSAPTISGNTTICSGTPVTLTSSSGSGNLWSNGATTNSISVSTAGTYSVRRIVSGCTSAASTSITITTGTTPSAPTVTGASSFCTGGSTVLTSSATTGNLWSTGATTRTITVTTAGSYTVRVVSGGCTSVASAVTSVTVTPLPTTPSVSGTNTFCAGGSTVLTSSSATGNLWTTGATTQSITVSTAGSYRVRVISSGCTSAFSSTFSVTSVSLPTTPTISGINSFCSGGSTVLTSNAATGNIWSNGATTQSITVNNAGSYTVRVISGSCTSAASNAINVTSIPLPNTPTISGTSSFCSGGSTVLTSSATTGNLWSTGATSQSITVNNADTYSVRVISGGCTSAVSDNIAVSVNDLPSTPTITSSNGTSICIGETTTLSTGISDAVVWSSGSTTPTITVGAGTYTVRAINASGCTSAVSGEVVITQQICNQTFTGVGNLNSNSNWSTGTMPASNTDITVDGVLTIGNNYTLRNISINAADTIKIPSGNTLTVTGSLNNDGVISGEGTLLVSGANNQNIGGGTISNLTVANGQIVNLSTSTSISGTLTLGANTTFDLNSNALILLSTAAKTARLAPVPSGASITTASNFTVQRWLNPSNIRAATNATGNYYYTGPVVQNQTVALWNHVSPYGPETFNQATPGGARFYFFNATLNAWKKPTSLSQALPAGTGVQVWFGTQAFFTGGRTTWSASGTPVIGNFNMPLTSGVTGFNLVSNPYPSTIDWDSPSWTKVDVANSIYVYDWVNQRYKSYVNGIGTNGGTRYLTTAQGFFISAITTNPVLTATENIKVSNHLAMQRSESHAGGLIRLQLTHGNVNDEMVIANREAATLAFEADQDAQKMMNPTTNLFVSGALNQSIASLNFNSANVIPFVLQTNTTGVVSLATTELNGLEGYTFNLFDEQTGSLLPFTGTETFSFNVNANQPYRLQLRVGSVTGINGPVKSEFDMFPNPAINQVTIRTSGNGTLEILNGMGTVVITQPAQIRNEINLTKLPRGVYTVRYNGLAQKLALR